MRFWGHLTTVTRHRFVVMKHCFRVGLYWQGLCHDLSKFMPSEFFPGVKYFQGNRSPQAREREVYGYSAAWLHHKGRNKHHFEYWTDFADGHKVYVHMPPKYLAEMICDRIAASKIYMKGNYDNSSPLQYFETKTDVESMNKQTAEELRYFLTMLKEQGEEVMFSSLKKFIKTQKIPL
jgi:hypothetical protein